MAILTHVGLLFSTYPHKSDLSLRRDEYAKLMHILTRQLRLPPAAFPAGATLFLAGALGNCSATHLDAYLMRLASLPLLRRAYPVTNKASSRSVS